LFLLLERYLITVEQWMACGAALVFSEGLSVQYVMIQTLVPLVMLCSTKTLCNLFLWNAAGICSAGGHGEDNRSRAIWCSAQDSSHRVKSNGKLSSLWTHGQRRQCFLAGDKCNSTFSCYQRLFVHAWFVMFPCFAVSCIFMFFKNDNNNNKKKLSKYNW